MENLFRPHKTNRSQRQQYKLNLIPKSNQVSFGSKSLRKEILRFEMPYLFLLNPKKICRSLKK